MFTKICALLRRKPVEPILAPEPIVKPRKKPTIKKATTRKIVAKPTIKTIVKKPLAKKVSVKKK